MTHIIVVCTVQNSWWWTEKLSKKCRVSFQEQIWEISASSWFYYKKFNTMHGHMNVKCYKWCSYKVSLQNIHSSPETVRIVKSMRLKWAELEYGIKEICAEFWRRNPLESGHLHD